MPGGDGKGPISGGQGRGQGGAGAGGSCVCPNCGHKINHQQGVPCNSLNCPKCGTKMARG
jgi:hypothetical protein